MKERLLTVGYAFRVLEMGGCGAVVGALAFTVVAGFITNAQPVPLMRYSPLIGGLIGGVFSFLVVVVSDFKRIKDFSKKICLLSGERKLLFLKESINSDIYPLQVKAIDELKKIKNLEAHKILEEASKKNLYL